KVWWVAVSCGLVTVFECTRKGVDPPENQFRKDMEPGFSFRLEDGRPTNRTARDGRVERLACLPRRQLVNPNVAVLALEANLQGRRIGQEFRIRHRVAVVHRETGIH